MAFGAGAAPLFATAADEAAGDGEAPASFENQLCFGEAAGVAVGAADEVVAVAAGLAAGVGDAFFLCGFGVAEAAGLAVEAAVAAGEAAGEASFFAR